MRVKVLGSAVVFPKVLASEYLNYPAFLFDTCKCLFFAWSRCNTLACPESVLPKATYA
jgi:hypothetical protein